MRSKFNAKHLADLVEEESKLSTRQRELATECNEMQASDTAWDEPRTAKYQRMQMEHAQVSRDAESIHRERVSYEQFEPRRAQAGHDGPFARFLRGGLNGLDAAEQKEHAPSGDQQLAGAGMEGFSIKLPSLADIQAMLRYGPLAISTGDNTNKSSDLVQETIPPRIVERLAYYGGVAKAAQQFMTAMGNPFPIPQMDARAEEGELLAAEATAITDDDLGNMGNQTFSATTASSKGIQLSRELVNDAVFDVQAYAERRALRRLGRIWNKAFTTTQTGTGLPVGVVSTAAAGLTAGATTAITYPEFVELMYSVNRAYREDYEGADGADAEMGGRLGWMMSDDCERLIRAMTDGEADNKGRPLWVPSMDGVASAAAARPSMFLGYPVFVNGHMAAIAQGTIPCLFGNFSYYGIRTVNSVDIFRFLDSRTIQNNAVECIAFSRRDGRPMGAIVSNNCEAYQKLTML